MNQDTTTQLIKNSGITLKRLEELKEIMLDLSQNDLWNGGHSESWISFVTDSQEILQILEFVGFPVRFSKDITGILVFCENGDYLALWMTEYSRPYSIYSVYHPLPFYRNRIPKYYPYYWQWDNEFYQL